MGVFRIIIPILRGRGGPVQVQQVAGQGIVLRVVFSGFRGGVQAIEGVVGVAGGQAEGIGNLRDVAHGIVSVTQILPGGAGLNGGGVGKPAALQRPWVVGVGDSRSVAQAAIGDSPGGIILCAGDVAAQAVQRHLRQVGVGQRGQGGQVAKNLIYMKGRFPIYCQEFP